MLSNAPFIDIAYTLACCEFGPMNGCFARYSLVKNFESGSHVFKLENNKNQPKKDKFEVPTQGVDQLLHVDQL